MYINLLLFFSRGDNNDYGVEFKRLSSEIRRCLQPCLLAEPCRTMPTVVLITISRRRLMRRILTSISSRLRPAARVSRGTSWAMALRRLPMTVRRHHTAETSSVAWRSPCRRPWQRPDGEHSAAVSPSPSVPTYCCWRHSLCVPTSSGTHNGACTSFSVRR